MPNDAKTRLDRDTHRLQDQTGTADPGGPAPGHATGDKAKPTDTDRDGETGQRQPRQAQQRDVTGTTLPEPDEAAKANGEP